MSHNIVMNNVRIKDLDMLGRIAKELSKGTAVLDKTAKTFRTERMLGGSGKCDAAIKMPGNLDIGLLLKNNAYSPVMGSMGMDTIFQVKPGANKIGALLREYAIQEAEYEAAQQGMIAERVSQPDGSITLELIEAA